MKTTDTNHAIETDLVDEQIHIHLEEVAYHLAEEDQFRDAPESYWLQAEELVGFDLAA